MKSTTSSQPEAAGARSENQPEHFPVVGIGASAGGLEAFRLFFERLPSDTGMAFVVVQHLSPEHPSLLTDALARHTSMPVIEAIDGMPLLPNRVHVMPSHSEMSVADDALHLVPRPVGRGVRYPIDLLFRSIASSLRNRAIGLVLSGTGSDGTQGLQAIKEEGGITFAQSVESAQFEGMPQSAFAAGVVDYVLPPEGIAEELVRLSRHAHLIGEARPPLEPAVAPEANDRILALVRRHSEKDFSGYKGTTIARRISRRMALRHVGTLEDYATLLERDAAEARQLSEDILIHVTGFFRDPKMFEALKQQVFPALVLDRPADRPLRAWIVGCSSGEEVYSFAISLLEFLGDTRPELTVQIFGTDLSERAIDLARAGLYPESALREVSPARLERFFTRVGADYRVSRALRDLCIFVAHDVTRDPPFARLDLISCRNVLIYFGHDLQRRLLPTFHYCLNRPGFLVLGHSENIGGFKELFAPVDAEERVFSKVGESRGTLPRLPGSRTEYTLVGTRAVTTTARPGLEAQRQADQLLIARFAPAGVVVNEQMEILQVRGRTGTFLELAPGQPQANLLKMAREGLRPALERAIEEAKDKGISSRAEGIRLAGDERTLEVSLEVVPLLGVPNKQEPYFLVLFEEAPHVRAATAARGALAIPRDSDALTQELIATKRYLESLVEQHRSAEEEFGAVNEELIAANEELQSTNEELESAKEELQSSNEELTTVNDELAGRNFELDRVATDLVNVLDSVDMPMVIVDGERRIRRFTPNIHAIASMLPSDIGRPLDNIKFSLDVPDLDERIAAVLTSGKSAEWEVRDTAGRWHRMQIRPYLASDRQPHGAVLSFVDIDLLKQALRVSEEARDYARAIVETVQTPLMVLDQGQRIVSTNRSFARAFGPAKEGEHVLAVCQRIWDVAGFRGLVESVFAQGVPDAALELERDVPGVGKRFLSITARRVAWGGATLALLAFEDLTERRRLEAEGAMRTAAEAASRAKDLFLATLSHELRTPLSAVLLQAQMLKRLTSGQPKTERIAAAIERSARAQSTLIEDLLDISRIVSGKLRLEQRTVELAEIVQAAVDANRSAAEAKGLKLEAALDAEKIWVYGDAGRLQQVVSNLLTNAIKFTPRAGTVSVRMERAGDQARVSVADTGAGIRPEFLPRLFERFSQADSAMTRTHGGLGLGLAIVRQLLELHGGQVEATSLGEGKGSTFTISLPSITAPLESAQRETPPIEHRSDVVGVRVLVVEDEEEVRKSLVSALEMAGATARGAGSAAEALAAFEGFKPQVLLTDLAMPGEDGYSLMAKVRALPAEKGGRVPAAAVTAFAGDDDRLRALAAGFQMHIPKPIDLGVLISSVARLAWRS